MDIAKTKENQIRIDGIIETSRATLPDGTFGYSDTCIKEQLEYLIRSAYRRGMEELKDEVMKGST